MSGRLRVLTYNVRSFRDDVAALVEVIRAEQPDVVCLQELPRFWRWRAKRGGFARRAGLVPVAGRARKVAVGVYVREGLGATGARDYLLSRTRGLHLRSVALIELAAPRVAIASIHLGLVEDERLRHAAGVAALVPVGLPVVVAGDVNDEPGSPTWLELTQRFADAGPDAPTFSAVAPRRRIDAVFVDPAIKVLRAWVRSDDLTARASDHLPVIVDLRIPG